MKRVAALSRLGKLSRVAAVLLTLVQVASAATVRGQLIRRSGNAHVPAVSVIVTVYNPKSGRSAAAHTDGNGMFYIPRILAGTNYLEVWTPQSPQKPRTYAIQVKEPITDIPAITIP